MSSRTEINNNTIPINESKWQYYFSLLDSEGNGFIDSSDIGILIRSMNYNITEQQVNDYINIYTNSSKCDFNTLINVVKQHSHTWSNTLTRQHVIQSIELYDPYNTGYLHGSILVELLSEYGEILSQDDIDNLLSEITIDGDNNINIKQFVDYMITSSSVYTTYDINGNGIQLDTQ